LATGEWLLDLDLDPTMSAERLGQFMLARMSEKAQAAHDTLATFNLLDLRSMNTLAQAVNDMADSMSATLQGHSARVLQIWQSLWDVQVGDSASIDISAFVDAIRADSSFYSVAGVYQTADRVQSTLDQVLVERRSTRQENLRKGMGIYSPIAPTPDDLDEYNTLQMSHDDAGWAGLLVAMQQSGSALVQVRGTVAWTGHNLQDAAHPLYVFLNTAQVGQPVVSLTAPITLTNIIRQDSVEFEASFALDGDSAAAYLGVFQDLNPDQQLSTGDRYGYFHHNPSPPRDWITIHSGDELDNLHIALTTQR
jgi:hypothetical protein